MEEVSRKLIIREEQLFSQDSPSEEEEDRLQRDFEALRLQLWMAIHNTFTPTPPSSSGKLEVLRSAVVSIQQQEVQDQRWMDCQEDRVPVWRPQKCFSTHNSLLQNIVESRMMKTTEDESGGADGLSSPLKREVSPQSDQTRRSVSQINQADQSTRSVTCAGVSCGELM